MIEAILGRVEQGSVMRDGVDPADFVARLRETRGAIQGRLGTTPAGAATARLLARLEPPLSRPLRVAVLGETNTGKTTLINRFLGSEILIADVIQNTRLATLVRYAESPSLHVRDAAGKLHSVATGGIDLRRIGNDCSVDLALPLPRLEGLELVDMPGLVPGPDRPAWAHDGRAPDIAIWCTLATQAWRASEIATWRLLQRPGNTSLLAATRSDLLPHPDRIKVLRRLQNEAGALFHSIVMTSPEKGSVDVLASALDAIIEAVRGKRCRQAAAIVARHLERLEASSGAAPEPMLATDKA